MAIRQGAAVRVWPVCQFGGAWVDLDHLAESSFAAQKRFLVREACTTLLAEYHASRLAIHSTGFRCFRTNSVPRRNGGIPATAHHPTATMQHAAGSRPDHIASSGRRWGCGPAVFALA
jgi:hypothetical protein